MSTKKDIGMVLKTAMDGYSAAPDNLWSAIESNLKRQRRNRILLLLLLLLLLLFGVVFWGTSNSNENTTTKVHQKKDTNTHQRKDNQKTSDTIDEDNSTPSQDSEILQNRFDSLTRNAESKSREVTKKATTSSSQSTSNTLTFSETSKNTRSKQPDTTKDSLSSSDRFNIQPSYASQDFIRLDLVRLDSLHLVIDSLHFASSTSEEDLKPKKENEFLWRVMPFVSADHYNAFGRNTSAQLTLNRGAFILLKGSDKVTLRTGHKELKLQYNFLENTTEQQQKVKYLEIPVEVQYFLSHKKKFKQSLILGASYLFLQEAFLRDFTNDFRRDNRNEFTKHMFSANMGLGLQYDIDKRWAIDLETWFKYHPYPYTNSQRFYPYTLSLTFGIQYKFDFK